ncbi:hypothetical protein V6L77_24790 [Pannonibacter sp. Pt2-lr]
MKGTATAPVAQTSAVATAFARSGNTELAVKLETAPAPQAAPSSAAERIAQARMKGYEGESCSNAATSPWSATAPA